MSLPGPVVGAGWLSDHLESIVGADCRWYLDGRRGADAHEAGHIPGAVFVDLDRDLAAPPGGARGRHPLPEPTAFASAMGQLGIGDDDQVVAYDDAGGSVAARLWWMLQAVGREAAVLDGGLAAWPGPLESGPVVRPAVSFTSRAWPAASTLDLAEVDRLRGRRDVLILDARAGDQHRGETEPIDPRAGHIPGARSAPFGENLDPDGGGFAAAAQLRTRFARLGAGDATEIVSYCGSGVTACHNLLAMEIAGVGGGRLFAGSWSAWSSDPARPAAQGPEPG